MTLVNIDIRNIASETHPDDRVVFYSPANRNAEGRIISTAAAEVKLVDGQGSIELEPGPVVTRLECLGISDTREKVGLVPTEGPITLADLIVDWLPAIVDQGILAILAALEDSLLQVEGAVDSIAAEMKESINRGNADAWLTVDDLPQYETLPTGNYRATSGFLQGIGLEIASAGRFVRTYTSNAGNFTDRVEYVSGGVAFTWFRAKWSGGLGAWVSSDSDAQAAISALREEMATQRAKVSRGTGEAWLTAADIPNYRSLAPGNYRALASFLTGVGLDDARTGRFVRTHTNSAGTTWIDHAMWIETGSIVHNRYKSVWSTGESPWLNDAHQRSLDSDISAARQEAVRERLIQSRGGRVGTAGKGVVALRFDHGVPAFTEHILPMLIERGLPSSQCHHVEDPEANWAQANINFGSGVEVHSHSWTHRDATTDEDIRKEIVESRAELERLIPNALVAGWMTPGIGSPGYKGWWDAAGLEGRAAFYAQELIDSTYASADTANSVWNALGSRHWTHRSIDRDSGFDQYQGLIDQAANTHTGVVIMVHPTFIRDQESYIDFSQYEQVLDYLVAQRDAGKIEVLTVSGMTLADPSTGYRDNMLHGDLSIWSGWGDGTSRTGTPDSGALIHAVSLANIPYVKGHVREFTLDAIGAGSLQIRIYDNDMMLLDVNRTVTVTDAQKIRIPVGIPLGGSRIRLTITCSSGSVTLTNPKLQAV